MLNGGYLKHIPYDNLSNKLVLVFFVVGVLHNNDFWDPITKSWSQDHLVIPQLLPNGLSAPMGYCTVGGFDFFYRFFFQKEKFFGF